jgi:hypothetical protein
MKCKVLPKACDVLPVRMMWSRSPITCRVHNWYYEERQGQIEIGTPAPREEEIPTAYADEKLRRRREQFADSARQVSGTHDR